MSQYNPQVFVAQQNAERAALRQAFENGYLSQPQVNPAVIGLVRSGTQLSDRQKAALTEDEQLYLSNPSAFIQKFGGAAYGNIETEAQQTLSPDTFRSDDRSLAQSIVDKGLGFAQGAVSGTLGLVGLGASALLPGSGIGSGILKFANTVSDWGNDVFASSYRKAAERARAQKSAAREELLNRRYEQDLQNGDSPTWATLKKLGRDTIQWGQDVINDENALEQVAANALGSLAFSGPLSKGLGLAGKALASSKNAFAKGLSKHLVQNLDEKASFASKMFGNEGITNALLETGGSLVGVTSTINNMSNEELLANPEFANKVQSYMHNGDSLNQAVNKAKDDLIQSVSAFSALITAPLAMASGPFTDKIIRSPFRLDSWSPLKKALPELAGRGLREAGEEGVQGLAQIGENIGLRAAGFDRDILEGVAQNIAEGVVGGGISGAGGPLLGPVTKATSAIATAPYHIGKGIYERSYSGQARTLAQSAANIDDLHQQINNNPALSDTDKKWHNNLTDIIAGRQDFTKPQEWNFAEQRTKHKFTEETKTSYDSSKSLTQNVLDLVKKAKALEKSDLEKAKALYTDALALLNYTQDIRSKATETATITQTLLTFAQRQAEGKLDEKRQNVLTALQTADPTERQSKVIDAIEAVSPVKLEATPGETEEALAARTEQAKKDNASTLINFWDSLSKRDAKTGKSILDNASQILPLYNQLFSASAQELPIQRRLNQTINDKISSLTTKIENKKAKEALQKKPVQSQPEVGKPTPNATISGSSAKPVKTITDQNQIQQYVNNPNVPLSWDSDSHTAEDATYTTGISADGKNISFLHDNTWHSIPLAEFNKAKQTAQKAQQEAEQKKAQEQQASQQTQENASEPQSQPSSEKFEETSKSEEKPSQNEPEEPKTQRPIEVIHEKKDASKPEGTVQNPKTIQEGEQESHLKEALKSNPIIKQLASDSSHILVQEGNDWIEYPKVIYDNVIASDTTEPLFRNTSSTEKTTVRWNPTTKQYEVDAENAKAFHEACTKGTVVVVDVETTAYANAELKADQVQIVELSAKKYVNGEEVDRITLFIEPSKGIGLAEEIPTTLNGQPNPLIAAYNTASEKVTFEKAYEKFIKFVSGAALIGHNIAQFDLVALRNNVEKRAPDVGTDALEDVEIYDTLPLAHKILPKEESYKLENLTSGDTAHTASADVDRTVQLIRELNDWYEINFLEQKLKDYTPANAVETPLDKLMLDLIQAAKGNNTSNYNFVYDNDKFIISVQKNNKELFYIDLKERKVFEKGEFKIALALNLSKTQQQVVNAALPLIIDRYKSEFASTTKEIPDIPEILQHDEGKLSLNPKNTQDTPILVKRGRNGDLYVYSSNGVIYERNRQGVWYDHTDTRNRMNEITDEKQQEWLNALVDYLEDTKAPTNTIDWRPKNYSKIIEYTDGVIEICDKKGKVIFRKTRNGTWGVYISSDLYFHLVGRNLNDKIENFYHELISKNITIEHPNTTKTGKVNNSSSDFTGREFSYEAYRNMYFITDRETGTVYRLSSASKKFPGTKWEQRYTTKTGEEKWYPCSDALSNSLTKELLDKNFQFSSLELIANFFPETTDSKERQNQINNPFDYLELHISTNKDTNNQIITITPQGSDTVIATATLSTQSNKPIWDLTNIFPENTNNDAFAEALFGNIFFILLGSEGRGKAYNQIKLLNPERIASESVIKQGTYIHNITIGSIHDFLQKWIDQHQSDVRDIKKQILGAIFWIEQLGTETSEFAEIFKEKLAEHKVFYFKSANEKDLTELVLAAAADTVDELNGIESDRLSDLLGPVIGGNFSFASILNLKTLQDDAQAIDQLYNLVENTPLGTVMLKNINNTAALLKLRQLFIKYATPYQSKTFKTIEALEATLNTIVSDVLEDPEASESVLGTQEVTQGQSMYAEMTSAENTALFNGTVESTQNILKLLFNLNSKSRNKNNLLNYFNDPVEALYQFFSLMSGEHKGQPFVSLQEFLEMFSFPGSEEGLSEEEKTKRHQEKQDANIRATTLYHELTANNCQVAKAFRTFFDTKSRNSLLRKFLQRLEEDFLTAVSEQEKKYLADAVNSANGSGILEAITKARKLNYANSMALCMTRDDNGNIHFNRAFIEKVSLAALASYFELAKIANGVHDNDSHQEVLSRHVDDSSLVLNAVLGVDLHAETVWSIFEAVKRNVREYLDLHPSSKLTTEEYDNILNSLTATMMQSMANMGLFTVIQADYHQNKDGEVCFCEIQTFQNQLDGSRTSSDTITSGNRAAEPRNHKTKLFIKVNNSLDRRSNSSLPVNKQLFDMAGVIQQHASYFLGNMLLGLDESGVHISAESMEAYQRAREKHHKDLYYKHSQDAMTKETAEEMKLRESQPSQVNLPFFSLIRLLNQDSDMHHAIAQYLGCDYDENDYGIATNAYLRSQKGKWINMMTSFRNLESIFRRIKADSEATGKNLSAYRLYNAYMVNIMGRFSMEEGAQAQQDKCWRQMFPVALRDSSKKPSIDLHNDVYFENFLRAICQGLGLKVARVLRNNLDFLYSQLDKEATKTEKKPNGEEVKTHIFATEAWKQFCKLVASDDFTAFQDESFIFETIAPEEETSTIKALLLELQNFNMSKSWLALDNLIELARLSNALENRGAKAFESFAEMHQACISGSEAFTWESNQIIENDGINSGFSHMSHILMSAVGNLTPQLLNVWHATGIAFAHPDDLDKDSAAYALYQSTLANDNSQIDSKSPGEYVLGSALDGYQMIANGVKNTLRNALEFNRLSFGENWPKSFGGSLFETLMTDASGKKREWRIPSPNDFAQKIVELTAELDTNFEYVANDITKFIIKRNAMKDPTMWFQYGAGLNTSAVKIVNILLDNYQALITQYNKAVQQGNETEYKQLYARLQKIARLLQESSLVHITENDAMGRVSAKSNAGAQNIDKFLPDIQEGEMVPSDFVLFAADTNVLVDNYKYMLVQSITNYMTNEVFGSNVLTINKNMIVSATQVMNSMYEAMQMAWLHKLLQEAPKEGGIEQAQLDTINEKIKEFLPTLNCSLELNNHEDKAVQLRKKLITMRNTLLRTLMNEQAFDFISDKDLESLENGRGLFQDKNSTLLPTLSGNMNVPVRTGGGVAVLIQVIQGLAEANIISAMTRSNPGLSFQDFYDGINFRLDEQTIEGTQLSNKYCYEVWTKLNVFDIFNKMLGDFNEKIFTRTDAGTQLNFDLASSMFAECEVEEHKAKNGTTYYTVKLNGLQTAMRDALFTLAQHTGILGESDSKEKFTKQIFSFKGNHKEIDSLYQPGLFQKILIESQFYFAKQARNQDIQNRALRGIYPLICDQLAGLGIGHRAKLEALPTGMVDEKEIAELQDLLRQGHFAAANELYIKLFNRVTTLLAQEEEYALAKYFDLDNPIFRELLYSPDGQKLIHNDVLQATLAPIEAAKETTYAEQMTSALYPENRVSSPKLRSLHSTVQKWIKDIKDNKLDSLVLNALASFLSKLASLPSILNNYKIIEIDKKLFHEQTKEERLEQIRNFIDKHYPNLKTENPKDYSRIVTELEKIYSDATRLAKAGGMYQSFGSGGGVIFIFTNPEKAKDKSEIRQKLISTIHEILHALTADFFEAYLTYDEQGNLIVGNASNGLPKIDTVAKTILTHLVNIFNSEMKNLKTLLDSDPNALSPSDPLYRLIYYYHNINPDTKTPLQHPVPKKYLFKEFVAYALSEKHIMTMLAGKQVDVEELGVVKAATEAFKLTTANPTAWEKIKQQFRIFAAKVEDLIKHLLQRALGQNYKEIVSKKENVNLLNDMYWSLQELFRSDTYTKFAEAPVQSTNTLFRDNMVMTGSLDERYSTKENWVENQRTARQLQESRAERAAEAAQKALLPSTTNHFAEEERSKLQTVASVFHLTKENIATYNDMISTFMRTYYLDRSQLKPFAEIQTKLFIALAINGEKLFITSDNPTREEEINASNMYNLLMQLQKESIAFPDIKKDLSISYALPAILGLLEVSPEMQHCVDSIKWTIPHEHPSETPNQWLRNLGHELHNKLHLIELSLPSKNPTLNEAYQARKQILNNIFIGNQESVFDKLPSAMNNGMTYLEEKFQLAIHSMLVKTVSKDMSMADRLFGLTLVPMLNIPHTFPTEFARKSLYFSNKVPKWMAEIGTDFLGMCRGDMSFYEFRKSLKHKVDYTRQHYRTNMPKVIRKMFGRKVSKHQWESLYRSLARTGIGTLIALHPDLVDHIPTLLNPQNKRIQTIETSLDTEVSSYLKKEVLKKAKQAAHYMVTGEAGTFLLKSSFAILEHYNVRHLINEDKINELISLYALQELSEKDKNILRNMLENYEEPMKKLMNYMAHLHLQEQSKISQLEEDLKNENHPNHAMLQRMYFRVKMNGFQNFIPVHRTDGTSMIVADDAKKEELERKGFQRVGDYNNSFAKNMGYYYSPIPQEADFMEGMFVITSPSFQGCYWNNGRAVQGVSHSAYIRDKGAVRQITQAIANGKVDSTTGDNLIPIFDGTDGKTVVGYEYALNPKQAAFIENKTELPEMLGILHGRQVEENIASQINTQAAKLVVENFDPNILKAHMYIDLLDPNLNPIQRDAVSRIPFEVLQSMKDAFAAKGYEGHIYIRKDLFIDIVGERKISIAEAFNPDASDMNKAMLNAIANTLTFMFGKNAMKWAIVGERSLQSTVSWAKSTIVVRSVQVCIINMVANIFHLMASGVPLKVILKEIPMLLDECETYVKNQRKIRNLELEMLSTFDEKAKERLQSQITAYEEANKMLGIADIIDEFSMINDLGRSSEELALSKGRIGEWIQEQINRLPDSVVNTGNFLLMGKDTPIFEMLEKATQYGDFIAKAILYRHWVRTGEKSPAEARARVLYEFVDYDKNKGRFRDYIESTGIGPWFMDYRLRIMRVAENLLKEHPLRAVLTMALPNPVPFIGDAGDVFSDSIIGKLFQGLGMSTFGFQMFYKALTLHPLLGLLF